MTAEAYAVVLLLLGGSATFVGLHLAHRQRLRADGHVTVRRYWRCPHCAGRSWTEADDMHDAAQGISAMEWAHAARCKARQTAPGATRAVDWHLRTPRHPSVPPKALTRQEDA